MLRLSRTMICILIIISARRCLILSDPPLRSQASLVRSFGHVLSCHPYVVNKPLLHGQSLVEFCVSVCPRPLLMGMFLSVPCFVGLNGRGLETVIASGNRRLVQQVVQVSSSNEALTRTLHFALIRSWTLLR